jgi:hypothetical protein
MWKWFLKLVLRSLVDSQSLEHIKKLVMMYINDTTLSGAEKKQIVIQQARKDGINIAGYLLNFIIESIVLELKK